MMAYYNEIDKFAASWLRALISENLIAPGEVDERSIEDVVPSDLMGYSQCHFFAGIGVWSHALRQAGWPDDRPVWTGSCPCQPFSAAGKGGGTSDERHLWPAFFWLIRQCRPVVVFGEQVEAALRHDWLDHVAVDLEAEGYAVGAVSSPACGYGAPHIRQRLYWVATLDNSAGSRCHGKGQWSEVETRNKARVRGSEPRCPARLLADAEYDGRNRQNWVKAEPDSDQPGERIPDRDCNAGIVGDSENNGRKHALHDKECIISTSGTGPTNGFWANAEWIPCRDGKARPTGRGIHPLVRKLVNSNEVRRADGQKKRRCDGEIFTEGSPKQFSSEGGEVDWNGPTQSSPITLADGSSARVVHSGDQGAPADEIDPQNTAGARVMRLRGYGNSIVAPQSEAFLRAYMEVAWKG